MMTLDEIRMKLHDRRPGIIAKATGLHPLTIQLIRDGKQQNPSYNTLCLLSKYFEAQQHEKN